MLSWLLLPFYCAAIVAELCVWVEATLDTYAAFPYFQVCLMIFHFKRTCIFGQCKSVQRYLYHEESMIKFLSLSIHPQWTTHITLV